MKAKYIVSYREMVSIETLSLKPGISGKQLVQNSTAFAVGKKAVARRCKLEWGLHPCTTINVTFVGVE